MNFIKKYLLFFNTFFGAVFGYVLLHPFGMMAHQVHLGGEVGFMHVHWGKVLPAFKMAFSAEHLPPAVLYIIFGGIMGFFIGKTIIAYRMIAKQLESFSLIGMNASSIIHDLNNPVATIKMGVEVLRRNIADTERIEIYGEIERDVARLSKMVTDIKIVAQGEKLIQLSKTPVELKTFLDDVVSGMTLRHEIKISCGFEGVVSIDKDYFERVIWNLLKNADEALAMTEGGKIELSVSKTEDSVLMCISDNGPGIPKEISKSLFEIGKTFGKKGGSGIGLYNCRIITESHGGKIWCISEEGKGTKFYIKIPK
ncbi:MAG TPA: HAMP domain-containing histidine kinase [Candidatus Omnitrophica bacterium]|nr:HAMP domain-containing histidine kinase [Candidatus Omnitrophota bacterium]